MTDRSAGHSFTALFSSVLFEHCFHFDRIMRAVTCGVKLWEGRVVGIPFFKVLQFDILVKFWKAKKQEALNKNITQPSRNAARRRREPRRRPWRGRPSTSSPAHWAAGGVECTSITLLYTCMCVYIYIYISLYIYIYI